jgi:hypothetical protein
MSAWVMSDEDGRVFLLEYARGLEVEIRDMCTGEVHPFSEARVGELLVDMRRAAYSGDAAEVHRLAGMCRRRIAQDLEWHREDMAKIEAFRQGAPS